MIRSLLVPLDGSPFGENALPLAASIARRTGATLQLVHVHAPLQASYSEIQLSDENLEDQVRHRNRIYLEDLGLRLEKEIGAKVETFIKDGEVEKVLRDHAASAGVDLVVMTTHARGLLGRFWLGSVADKLIRDLSVPLLLVHPSEKSSNLATDVFLKRLLLPLDGSPLGEQILEPAVELGSVMGADYSLFRVVQAVFPFNDYPAAQGSMAREAQALIARVESMQLQLKEEAQRYLETVAQRLRARSLNVQCEVAVEDLQPATAIVHKAETGSIDAVALATHGRRGLSRFFLGSVADKVVRGCGLPILVYRPKAG